MGLSRYYNSPPHIFSQKGPHMHIDEMLKRLVSKYGKYPEKQPVGEQRIEGHGEESSVAKKGRKES